MAAWFPCQHPEQVRIAQSVGVVGQLRTITACIVGVMVLGLAVQIHSGFGLAALVWQAAMGVLAWRAYSSWRRLCSLPPPSQVSARHINKLTLHSGLFGLCWGIGILAWSLWSPPELAALIIAVSLTFAAYAVAISYFVPAAVVAFSAPLFVASVLAAARVMPGMLAWVSISLIAMHALSTMRLLTVNWKAFARSIDVDVERERLAAMLREQKEIAERTVHQKSRFLASASHDLRQPMHAISLYLDGLSDMDLPERAQHAVGDARICAHDMIDMFRSFLDISRLDAQHAVPVLGVFSVDTVLSRVEKEFLPLARSRGVHLKVRPSGAHVYSDAVMVERMALNFVSNAVRHVNGGRVLVACRIRGKYLRLAVYDNGPGIPEEDQQTIFEEFRGSGTNAPDRTGGLGLGLAIVKRLAHSLRVPVVVRSTAGRGSMFAIDLPLVHVPHGSREGARVDSVLTGKFVVLVDDEPAILKATSFILERAGCVVASARTSREAIDNLVAGTRVPDAIICDYELNDRIKGPEVIRLLREEFNCDVPALLVTGDTAGGAAERAGRQMEIPVLYKPLEAGSLTHLLEGLLAIEEH
jgi:signal transduction histidine kinase